MEAKHGHWQRNMTKIYIDKKYQALPFHDKINHINLCEMYQATPLKKIK
jgi:hypothetical protein